MLVSLGTCSNRATDRELLARSCMSYLMYQYLSATNYEETEAGHELVTLVMATNTHVTYTHVILMRQRS